MRHATEEDLNRLEGVLSELRRLPQLRERKRGIFVQGSRAFLHFHEDAGQLYCDVRLDRDFERRKVTTAGERATFLAAVRASLRSTP